MIETPLPPLFDGLKLAAREVGGVQIQNAGTIAGKVNFVRMGNSTTILTNASTYTGETVVRGGNLTLVDSGALQLEVDPSQEDLLRRHFQELFVAFAVLEKRQ